MTDYTAPLDDIKFTLGAIADIDAICELPGYEEVDVDTVHGVLDELGRFVEEVIAPSYQDDDRAGCSVEDGVVTVPDSFQVMWDQYVAAGWGAVVQDPDYGGGGFPQTIGTVINELFASANRSWTMGPLLTNGAIDLLHTFADEQQKETYLPKMVSTEWSGTMNLTEPEAGSDVGALSTRAVPQDDGTYRIFGTKIFITFGEHDLTENIIQLVLARTPDSPPGTKGISCFIVPKFLVNDDGSLGDRNDYKCVSVEHKLGLHASPTCVMSYGDAGDGAIGYLIGEEHQGMRYMFKMMNNARLGVGVEGLAVSERALQAATEFAIERKQGRAVGDDGPGQSSIIMHADVRRMLMTMRAYTQAMRCLLYLNASCLDIAARHPDEARRESASALAELLTPISKGWSTDLGVEMSSMGVQVHGGYGYIEETGAAQILRDSRISPIYEGTNGIQAIDLVGRKLPMAGGAVMSGFLDEMEALDGPLGDAGEAFASIRANLADGVASMRKASAHLLGAMRDNPNDGLAGATPFLKMFGQVTGGYLLAKLALADGAGDEHVVTARFYAEQLLPQGTAMMAAVAASSADLFALSGEDISV